MENQPKSSLILRPSTDLILPAHCGRRAFFRRVAGAGLAAAVGPFAGPLGLLGLSAALFPKEASAVTTDKIAYGTYAAMTVTNLQSLANDATDSFAGWQSDRISNVATLADDYEVVVHLPMANTAAANDKAVYVYLVPWVTTDGGTTWVVGANFSSTTLPTGAEGTASMSEPNSMRGPIAFPYIATQQIVNGFFTVGQLCGGIVPDGWSLALRNCTGAALSTGCVVAYRPVTYTNG